PPHENSQADSAGLLGIPGIEALRSTERIAAVLPRPKLRRLPPLPRFSEREPGELEERAATARRITQDLQRLSGAATYHPRLGTPHRAGHLSPCSELPNG